jgi:hypothetical protein
MPTRSRNWRRIASAGRSTAIADNEARIGGRRGAAAGGGIPLVSWLLVDQFEHDVPALSTGQTNCV